MEKSRNEIPLLRRWLTEDGHLSEDPQIYLDTLAQINPEAYKILQDAKTLEAAREGLHAYLCQVEQELQSHQDRLHPLIRDSVLNSLTTLRTILSPASEKAAGTCALDTLRQLVLGHETTNSQSETCGFVIELVYLFAGLVDRMDLYTDADAEPAFLRSEGREAARHRSKLLDTMSDEMDRYIQRYPSGLQPQVMQRREANRRRILDALGGTEADWLDHRWHLKHVFKRADRLEELVGLTSEETAAIRKAVAHKIPFGVTPFYLSLMDPDRTLGQDHAIRAQVFPPPHYIDMMVANKDERSSTFDFMGEQDTSPQDLITRRYPRITILKPYNTCAQICVYCQRNWEIDECMAPDAMSSKERIDKAVSWLQAHPSVREVLVTGGDPMVMPDRAIERLLDRLSTLEHLYRIRIGTRTPVVLPQRWTDELADLIARYHEPGRREVAVVTHFQHSYEITPEAMQAVQQIRRRGLSVYNQQVFNIENARRFESSKLRLDLRSIGVDPYYTFNMKGKEETRDYMAPISRLLQERKEEARLLPGLDRTDEPVFNVPRLGKNHVHIGQHHRLLSIQPDGRRVYAFHPWEKNLALVPLYIYVDVSIFDFLQRLADRGENLEDYRTIWYYF